MKLRTHYLLLVCSVLFPVVLFSGIALKLLLDAQRTAAIARIEESARAAALAVDADVGRAQSVLRTLGGSYALARGDLAAFYAEAQRANAGSGAWIILYDESGQQLINTRRPFGETLPVRPDPALLAQMLQTGQGAVTGMKWGEALHDWFVAVEQPITSASGRRLGLLQAFSPAYFNKAFASRDLPSSWLAGLFDQNGTIMARSQNAEQFVGKPAKAELRQALAGAHTGVLHHFTSDGREVYDIYTHTARTPWGIAIGAPASEIDAVVWHGFLLTGTGLLLALFVAGSMAAITGRQLIRFTRRAADAARGLGSGAVTPLYPSNINEFEDLNHALHDAAARLREEIASRSHAEAERNALLVSERQARAVAEKQNVAKDEFLAMLGHELRNPLSAVTGAVALLDDPRIAPEQAGRAHEILRRQSAHLRKLVDDLLEVHRALMGKLTLDRRVLDIAPLVRDSVAARLTGGGANGCAIEFAGVPTGVYADGTRIAQIVDNLLDNAIKYSPGGSAIALTLAHEGERAVLRVRDHGVGIGPELLPNVFTVFVQGEQTLQRAQGGLGIGLTLVRRLVEMHDGSIAIDSPGAGMGTTVTVSLPRVELVAHAAGRDAAPGAASHRRVLLVEDNLDAREMMALLLELEGCAVLAAGDGMEALTVARRERPDIAFIDIGLPGMNGYAVARELKADAATRDIRLVALTGYGSAEDRQRALAAGFDSHAVKPLSLDDLRKALGSV
jgi:signal transduction histidine kinase